jgi:hypothetical protein
MGALQTAATLNGIPQYVPQLLSGRRYRNYGLRSRLRNRIAPMVINQNNRRRNRRRRNGLEINRAEGGYKQITIPYKQQTIGINTYARLAVNKVGETWLYAIQPENDNYANHVEYNIITMLNDSTEFKDRLKTTSQYKLKRINICIMNERIPEAGDKLSRLLAYCNTTKVSVLDPKVQNNVMRLNMNTIGTKNFNFNITNDNIGKEFNQWYDGEDLYVGNVYLHVQGEDINNLTSTETTLVLGTIKITFVVATRIQDYTRNNEPTKKKTEKEEIREIHKQLDNITNSIKKLAVIDEQLGVKDQ